MSDPYQEMRAALDDALDAARYVVAALNRDGDRYWLHTPAWCRAVTAWPSQPHGACRVCETNVGPDAWLPMFVERTP